MHDRPARSTHADCRPSLAAAAAVRGEKKACFSASSWTQGWDAPTSTEGCSLLGSQEPEPGARAGEPEPKRLQERRGPAVLGPAGAAEAEAGAAGARWGCLKEIYNHFLSVVW